MGEKRTRREYSPEFKREAVALYRTSGKSRVAIGNEIGVHGSTLGNWIRQDEIDRGEVEGLTTDEREELVRLRKDNRVLQMERDLLKKATAFFAKDNETK